MSLTEARGTVGAAAGDAGGVGAARASYRTDLVTTLLGLWFAVGLLLDAWAHNNVPRLESFFTPWHAVFYSGFAVTAAWILWTVRRSFGPGGRTVPMPTGYRAAALAVPGFALFGVGDMLWHLGFGIEQNIDILFSPTHLGLLATMMVIITTPLRSAWADPGLPADPGLRRLLPAVLATGLAATLVLLIIQYGNVLSRDAAGVIVGLSDVDIWDTDVFVSSLLITNLVLVVPLIALARRWVLPFGTVTLMYLFPGALSAAVDGFENLDLILVLLGTGLVLDVLVRWLRPGPGAVWRNRLFGALAPLLTWSVYVVAADLLTPVLHRAPEAGGGTIDPVPELYTGAPLVQALVGLLAAVLLTPRRPS